MKTPHGTEVDLGPGHIERTQQPPLSSVHVYCGHGRPSQLLLSSCLKSVSVFVVRSVFGRFVLCYRTRCPVCLSCPMSFLPRWCTVAKRLELGWIKMKLGVQVGLGPGHIVLDGAHLLVPKKGERPHFRPMSVVAQRLH